MKSEVLISYNDKICFRQCSLANAVNSLTYGNCTNFYEKEENWKRHYYCCQNGIHLHCIKHQEQELKYDRSRSYLLCPICNEEIEVDDIDEIYKDCLKILNIPILKSAELIRIDDWYVPEIKKKTKLDTNYWLETDVKHDKQNNTVIVLYVGKKDSSEKVQYFIKPEKCQLSHDHNDLDPATILSKIEVTLKDRIISEVYDEEK